MTYSIPILLYHRIDATRSDLSTTPAEFRRHMQWLSARGWRSLSLDEFSFYARSGKDMPSHSFLLSFDDGYESVATEAAAVLQEFNFKAVCFLCTRLLRDPDGGNDLQDVDNSCYMRWEQARALQQSGLMEFQSHTHNHRKLDGATQREVMEELGMSRDWLSHELRLPKAAFTHLAWPWGESTEEWRLAAVRCGLHYQYTVARQSFDRGASLQHMPRTCYDGATLPNFQTQFWLQVGPLANLWNAAYPALRRLRRPAAGAPAGQPRAESGGLEAEEASYKR